jgi:hypothetical protein
MGALFLVTWTGTSIGGYNYFENLQLINGKNSQNILSLGKVLENFPKKTCFHEKITNVIL